ncbi:MAG: VOC family protein [Deltaproteobacteria bacterium]|nr:VOC family protein [Deltaproteobacteria bacterium]
MAISQKLPEGFQTVTAYLTIREGEKLIEFLKRAFGATETFRAAGSAGSHVQVKIGDSTLMIGVTSDPKAHETPAALFLYLDDAVATYHRAIAAGANSIMEPQDRPYGEGATMTKSATVKDQFGNTWYLTTYTHSS